MIDWDALVLGPTVRIFGEPVTYTSCITGQVFAITAVFDEAYMDLMPVSSGSMDVGEPTQISTTRPVLGVQISQFLASPPHQGDVALVRGAQYWVREVRADGHGSAKLLLNYVEAQMP